MPFEFLKRKLLAHQINKHLHKIRSIEDVLVEEEGTEAIP